MDHAGAVCGVTAVHDDETLEIETKSVVVATGCFSANREMVTRAFPEHFAKPGYYACIGLSSATGDGITMCEKAGAEVLDFVELGMPGLGHHPWTWNIHAAAGRGKTMWVNKNGERMVDEATVSMDAGKAVAARQPDALIYSIADSHILDLLQQELAQTLPPNELLYLGDLHESYEKESAQGKVHCVRGNTIEELAENMERVAGVNRDAFLQTVARYNEFCGKAHDDEMLKEEKYLIPIQEGPFYAALLQRFYEITQGGIEVDHNMQVKKQGGGVIPGLYAAGDTSSASGNSLNGTGLALAFVSGYVAADEAVKKLK